MADALRPYAVPAALHGCATLDSVRVVKHDRRRRDAAAQRRLTRTIFNGCADEDPQHALWRKGDIITIAPVGYFLADFED